MARIVLTDASVVINGINLSEFITSVSLSTSEDVVDTTGMGSAGARTRVAGLVPTPQLTTIWDPKTTNIRPAISAVRNAVLPAAGMTFEIPRVKTAPTVAAAAEKGAFSDTQTEIEYVSCSVAKYAGMQKFDVEVLDRTSPAFFDELVRLMANAYAKATDTAMVTALQAEKFVKNLSAVDKNEPGKAVVCRLELPEKFLERIGGK